MYIGLWKILTNRKKMSLTLSTYILTLILAMSILPFASAHSGDVMNAPPASVPVSIDGVWNGSEWDDAPQYTLMDPLAVNISYIRVKYNSTHLLVIIDSVWDTTGASVYPMENTWIAIDTAHNAGGTPQWDDYLIHIGATTFWQGNTTTWQNTWIPSVIGMQSSSAWGPGLLTSPNSGVPHRIDEMAIPLTHVGAPGSTVGFYVMVEDDSSDPDGMGWLPPTVYSEWPPSAGGSPGWPGGWGAAPCPAPNAWGNLTLLYTNLAITSVTPSVSTVVKGGSVNVDVLVSNNGTTTNGHNVAVFYLPNGSFVWGTWFGSQYVSLAPGTNTTLSFSWDTTWISPGAYQIRSSFEWGWSDDTPSDDMALSGPVTVTAVQRTLTVTSTVGGGTSPSGSASYDNGTSVSVSAFAFVGYTFNHWELDSVDVGSTNPYNVLMDADHTLHAVFEESPLEPRPPPAVGGDAFPIIVALTQPAVLLPLLIIVSLLIIMGSVLYVQHRKTKIP